MGAAEKAFFSHGRYRDLPGEMTGISSLCTRLSHLLYKHLKTELPALQKELNDKHRGVCRELERLGEKRATVQEQRRFLMAVSTKYQDIVSDAVKGHYEDTFFGFLDPDTAVDDETNMRRLRAVVQHLNIQFADLMRSYGQKFKIVEDASTTEQDTDSKHQLDDGYAHFTGLPEDIDRKTAVQRVSKILIRSRGRELPCTFNPLLISRLFWEQSENWKEIAAYHIERVADVCARFVKVAIAESVSSDVSSRLIALKVDQAMASRLSKAQHELSVIIQDSKRHPITYDPRYVETVQKRRSKLYDDRVQELAGAAESQVHVVGNTYKNYIDPAKLQSVIEARVEPNIEKISAEEALDDSLAYYEVCPVLIVHKLCR